MILLTVILLVVLKLLIKIMNYTFKLDTLQKVWYRNYITIEAESEKEAIVKAIELAKEELEDGFISQEVDYGEYILETVEPVFVEENQGNATVELEYDNQIIWTNNQVKI